MFKTTPIRIQETGFFALLTLASVFVANPYAFGLDNHFITLPFIWEKAYPELFPGDLVIAEMQYFYTWFLDGIVWLWKTTGLKLEILFFGLHLLIGFLTFWAFFYLARVISGSRAVAAVACMLLLFGTKTIGYVGTIESQLMERTVVLPLEFLALAWMLQRRWIMAFGATGLAFCIHPLSSFYIGGMIAFAGLYFLWTKRQEPLFKRQAGHFTLGIMAGAVAAIPGLYLKAHSAEPVMPIGVPLPGWLEILELRSSYHVFPFDWPIDGWFRAAAFWMAVWIVNRSRKNREVDRMVIAAWCAVGLMAVFGMVFSEFFPLSLPIQFQFFRSYPFAFMLGMIFLARGMVRAVHQRIPVWHILVASALALPAWLEMDLSKYGAMVFIWALMLGIGLYGVRKRQWPLRRMIILPLVFVLMLAPASINLSHFQLTNQQDPQWVAVQQWARKSTPPDAGFIVPPAERGFRVDSHRTVFVDWNDGTQNFFNQEFGQAWLARMQMAGFNGNPADMKRGFQSLVTPKFLAIAENMPASGQVYAVLYGDMRSGFPTVFENGKYRVVRVR